MSAFGIIGNKVMALVSAVPLLLALSYPTRVDDCGIPSLNTYQRSVCEMMNEQAARARTQRSLDRAIRAAKAVLKISVVNFVPGIRRTQKLWAEWAAAECALESEAMMGSAEAFVVHICRRKLDEIREHSLDALSSQLEALEP
jgi:hypothetical protein